MKFEGPLPWSLDALIGLTPALGDWSDEELRRRVVSNECQIYRVDGNSWLLVEERFPAIIIWCYVGERAVDMWIELGGIAQAIGFKHVCCLTRHKGILRAFRCFNPQFDFLDTGEIRCTIATEALTYESKDKNRCAPYPRESQHGRRRIAGTDFRQESRESVLG